MLDALQCMDGIAQLSNVTLNIYVGESPAYSSLRLITEFIFGIKTKYVLT